MKKCPKCGQVFDPDLDFCLEDGSRLKALLADSSDIPTREIQTPRTLRVPVNQTDVIPNARTNAQQKKGPGAWVYVVIALLALGLIVAVGIIIILWALGGGPAPSGPVTNANSVANANKFPATSPSPGGPTSSPANSSTPQTASVVSGTWVGEWNGDRALYTARVELTETNGKVEGKIFWTIVRIENAKPNEKPGTTATEYVRGTYNQSAKLVDVSGYRTDDPNHVIEADHYRMTLSTDGQSLGGKTNSGTIKLHR